VFYRALRHQIYFAFCVFLTVEAQDFCCIDIFAYSQLGISRDGLSAGKFPIQVLRFALLEFGAQWVLAAVLGGMVGLRDDRVFFFCHRVVQMLCNCFLAPDLREFIHCLSVFFSLLISLNFLCILHFLLHQLLNLWEYPLVYSKPMHIVSDLRQSVLLTLPNKTMLFFHLEHR